MLPLIADTSLVIHETLEAGHSVLFEGAQATLLDLDHGTYPFVTSSTAVAAGAAVGAGVGPQAVGRVLGVSKAYMTRVGEGPFPTEMGPEQNRAIQEKGKEFGATTRRPRRCGWFDSVVLRYARRVNGLDELAITKLDVLDGLAEVRIGVRYRLDGEPVEEFPGEFGALARCEPEYRTLPAGTGRPRARPGSRTSRGRPGTISTRWKSFPAFRSRWFRPSPIGRRSSGAGRQRSWGTEGDGRVYAGIAASGRETPSASSLIARTPPGTAEHSPAGGRRSRAIPVGYRVRRQNNG